MPAGRIYTPDPVAPHPLNEGLVAWWLGLPEISGGRQFFDLLGRCHGTLTNGPAWVGYDGGGPLVLGGVSLDGSDDEVDQASPSLGTTHTISFLLDYRNAADAVVIGGADTFYGPYIDGPGGGGAVYYRAGGAPGSHVSAAHGGLTSGTWYHLAIVRNGTAVAIYKNGLPLGSGTLGANNTQALTCFGNYAPGRPFSFPLAGRLADVRFQAVALTGSGVRGLYDQTRLGHPDTLRRVRPWVSLLGASPPPPPPPAAGTMITDWW